MAYNQYVRGRSEAQYQCEHTRTFWNSTIAIMPKIGSFLVYPMRLEKKRATKADRKMIDQIN